MSVVQCELCNVSRRPKSFVFRGLMGVLRAFIKPRNIINRSLQPNQMSSRSKNELADNAYKLIVRLLKDLQTSIDFYRLNLV